MKGFDPGKIITDPNELYGRNHLLDQLLTHVKRNNIVQLIGMRRFGKTSLLKCLQKRMETDISSKIFPIYVDFKEKGSYIKGTGNVYRFLVSKICQITAQSQVFDSTLSIKSIKITPSNEWEDIFEQLEQVRDVRLPGLFKDITCFFSELSEKTFYFLFDEYEYLFRFTLDNPQGFMAMRGLSAERINNGIAPFGFIISGTLSFEKLCSLTGSGELNVVSDTVFVPPIDEKSFLEMIQFGYTNLGINIHEDIIESSFLYNTSGGVPFYGKLLAESWIVSGEKPDHMKLFPYFEELYHGLGVDEKEVLSNVAAYSSSNNLPIALVDLLNKGVLENNTDKFHVKSSFFEDYIIAKSVPVFSKENDSQKLTKLVKNISKLISSINNDCKNKSKDYIFCPTNDDALLMHDLQTPCFTNETLAYFANSLYKIVFERTKIGNNSLANLPQKYKDGNNFIKVVDILRHSLGGAHLMDTFNQRPNKMTKEDMLILLLGSRNEPSSPEDFITLQLNTLKMFEKDLEDLMQLLQTSK